jgi:hypothetical protein
MAENTNLNLTVEAWAKIVVERWLDKINKLQIKNSHDLMNSFVWEVYRNADGDPQKISFAFHFYGKFVDMGVGKGVSFLDVGILKESRRIDGDQSHNRRRPKPWYSKTLYSQLKVLTELMADKYAIKSGVIIFEGLKLDPA